MRRKKIKLSKEQMVGLIVLTALASKQVYDYVESKIRRYKIIDTTEQGIQIIDVEFKEIEQADSIC